MKIFKKYRITIMKYICILVALIGAEIGVSVHGSASRIMGIILFFAGIICTIVFTIKGYKENK